MMLESEPMATMASRNVVLHEIDLGAHSLFVMSDQSIDLIAHEGTLYMADNVLSLDACETYRLLISLQEVFK